MTIQPPFDTAVTEDASVISGPVRTPKNMLAEQIYGGHASIHDDATAQKHGFKAATIEGPTHFSQFIPLAVHLWGERWFKDGCLSASYKMATHEGEGVRAFMARPKPDQTQTSIWMQREDGAEVLRGTASVGDTNPPSALESKLASLPAPDPLRVILQGVTPGTARPREKVRMGVEDLMGALYPFSLRQKLGSITEPSHWYASTQNPWGKPIIPFEMVSVLLHHLASSDPWLGKEQTIDLFVDQEIRMVNGPLLVGEEYEIVRSVVGLSGSRRTESSWVKTEVFRPGSEQVLASMLLNVASFKDSYPEYEAKLARLKASAA